MRWKSRARCLGAKNERGAAEGRIGQVAVVVGVVVAVVVEAKERRIMNEWTKALADYVSAVARAEEPLPKVRR